SSLPELIKQLGEKRFGHTPRIGDCFAGGGSIPFESARLGADVYASDLNPIASLLTWSSHNIVGASQTEIDQLRSFQQTVFDLVDKQITEWEIEHNEEGHRADSYLYCNETICPECGYKVPLAPSWIIGKGTKTVAILKDNSVDGFDIEIIQGASKEEYKKAEEMNTVKNGNIYCPYCKRETPITVIRRDKKDEEGNTIYGLRRWDKQDFTPRKSDVFQERLYCIRYVKEYIDDNGNLKTERYFRTPTQEDLKREEKVISLLSERFIEWQKKGYIPSSIIDEGYNTDQPIRERGWQYWHQLFHPRQLLTNGLFSYYLSNGASSKIESVGGLLGLNKVADFNSKLSVWLNLGANENTVNTFYNQAFNTLFNFATKTVINLKNSWFYNINNIESKNDKFQVEVSDARNITQQNDLWITDPPYADAVNYHELTEFFLAWDDAFISKIFPNWYTDSKRILAVKGTGETFNNSMIEIYKNLTKNMPNNGTQVVMFTHQDVKVWAELAMILWSSGLRVVSAWNIATETDSGGLKSGNYVKGTVLLVLKKQTS
ncbi:DNA methylase, partial [Mycobacteroides abscessus subsp. abscessus]|nr:DNA methylase [Mycobacteroides abscessus subsp. abscessus]